MDNDSADDTSSGRSIHFGNRIHNSRSIYIAQKVSTERDSVEIGQSKQDVLK